MARTLNEAREAGVFEPIASTCVSLDEFGPYRLVGLIARGGMAELYLAVRDQRPIRQVLALKRVLQGVGDAEVFAQEAALAARLEHPNIVRVFDFGEIEGQVYLAMEYLPGEDLERIIECYGAAGNRMPLRMAAEIACRMAAGLAYAHALSDDFGQPVNLVHRDVTPSNVMVTYQGTVKLVDFGIAKAWGQTLKTSEGATEGKLAYLAPESFTGKAVDARSDVYSVGCVLWEMLVGARPFEAPNDAALMNTIVHGTLPEVRQAAPDVDDALAAICMKAIARAPLDRFASAADLEAALKAYLDAHGGRLENTQIAQWMTGLFGPKQAGAKLDVASATRLSTAFPRIITPLSRSSPSSRSRVSSEARVTSTAKSPEVVPLFPLASSAAEPEPHTPPLPQPWVPRVLVAALIAGVLGATGVGLWLLASEPIDVSSVQESSVRESKAAVVVVESAPPGAAVFVDSAPLGRVTPTTLSRLRPGQALLVGVQRAGYEPNERRVVPSDGQSVERFTLSVRRGKP